jgi:thiol-disulfide isomerase/thioredoxin
MTVLQRRYLKSAIGAVCGVVIAVAIIGLLEQLGGGHEPRSFARGDVPPEMAAGPSPASQESTAVMSLHDAPRTLPEIRFADGNGRSLTLGDFQGKVILLNIWATWCGPCREEMPTLDRLQARLGGPHFEVVALSIDRAGIGVVSEFYDEIGVEHLAKYIDEGGKSAGQLSAVGLPTTLLIDRDGREVGRHVGPAEWDTPEMVEFLERQIAQASGARWPGRACRWADDPAGRTVASNALRRTLRPTALDAPVSDANTSSAFKEGNRS